MGMRIATRDHDDSPQGREASVWKLRWNGTCYVTKMFPIALLIVTENGWRSSGLPADTIDYITARQGEAKG